MTIKMDVSAGKARTIVRSKSFEYRNAVWSPDGQQIGYVRCVRPDGLRCDVFVANDDGTHQHRLTRTRGGEFGLAWRAIP